MKKTTLPLEVTFETDENREGQISWHMIGELCELGKIEVIKFIPDRHGSYSDNVGVIILRERIN